MSVDTKVGLMAVATLIGIWGLGMYLITGLEEERDTLKGRLDAQTARVVALEATEQDLTRANELLENIYGFVPTRTLSTTVTVTAYSARVQECDADPWRTADMSLVRLGMIAVSRDLMGELGLKFGDVVVLEGLGVFRVHDLLNKRFRRRVDILHTHAEAARQFGKRVNVNLTWVRG